MWATPRLSRETLLAAPGASQRTSSHLKWSEYNRLYLKAGGPTAPGRNIMISIQGQCLECFAEESARSTAIEVEFQNLGGSLATATVVLEEKTDFYSARGRWVGCEPNQQISTVPTVTFFRKIVREDSLKILTKGNLENLSLATIYDECDDKQKDLYCRILFNPRHPRHLSVLSTAVTKYPLGTAISDTTLCESDTAGRENDNPHGASVNLSVSLSGPSNVPALKHTTKELSITVTLLFCTSKCSKMRRF